MLTKAQGGLVSIQIDTRMGRLMIALIVIVFSALVAWGVGEIVYRNFDQISLDGTVSTEWGKLAGSITFFATFMWCCKKPEKKKWFEDRGPYVVAVIEFVSNSVGGFLVIQKRKYRIWRWANKKNRRS
jgi:hypothetical protein